ncbi:tetratricopeptide repeat protein [Leptolyngbyaceae cyanobacterium UHCC 1019]
MTSEEAIQIADEVLLAHAGNPLTDIQRMILRESLAGNGYEDMKDYGYTTQHIKNVGKKLWDLLSEALQEKVSKTNFKGALEKRLKSGRTVLKPPMPSTYKQQTWVGRKAAVSDLLTKLQGQIRLLWITGISGIGKTTLGECLASQAWESDPSFQWIYLEILEGQSPGFASVAADLLSKMGIHDLDPQGRNNPEQLAKRLLQKLTSHFYWIQLDSLERLLNPEQPTKFDDPYWAVFFQHYLTESGIISRLVLTSQAFPTALVEFGDRYPNTWAEIRLTGLSEVEQRLEFFAKRGIAVEPINQDILTYIAETYEGHPLVLKVIAEDIKEFPGGVDGYWKEYQPEFEQVARELQATRLDEMDYNEALDRQVRERIKRSLKQLPADALDLLCRSAVFRRPVPKKFWLVMIGDCTTYQQKAAYRMLGDRALIEREGIHQGQFLIRQHNLIRDVAYDLLKADTFKWETAESQAAHLWLTAYEPPNNAPNLETVRGYLEAFHHYCETERWHDAYTLIANRLDTPTQEQLHNQLNTWSYYQEQISLYKKVEDQLDENSNKVILHNLGNAYLSIGNFEQALSFYLQRLKIAKQEDDLQSECTILQNLGLVYKEIKKYDESICCSNQGIEIAERIEDFCGKAVCLRHLGLVYKSQHKYQLAKKVLEESKAILEHSSDLRSECATLGSLGQVYAALNEYDCASQAYLSSLQIARKIGDRYQQLITLKNLGELRSKLDTYAEAINYYQEALKLAKEIPDRKLEGDISGNLGFCYRQINQLDKSFAYSQKYLYVSRENGNYIDQITALINLGATSYTFEKYSEAMTFFKEALDISQNICDLALEGTALINIGSTQFKLEQYQDSLNCIRLALAIFQKIDNKAREAVALKKLSMLHQFIGEAEVAQQYCQQALALATELGIPLAAECEALLLAIEDRGKESDSKEGN